ncbi:MAG: MerR family transcriptional regulator [Acidimicrobiia bacterium]|nr:MerR family transcriptional regulator [Acidimicrobiia bacterium]
MTQEDARLAAPGLVLAERLSLSVFSSQCDLHPDLLRRLVDLGLVDPAAEEGDELWFTREQLSVVARAQRLHDGLSLNWVAVGVVMELLDRIEDLEEEVDRLRRSTERD